MSAAASFIRELLVASVPPPPLAPSSVEPDEEPDAPLVSDGPADAPHASSAPQAEDELALESPAGYDVTQVVSLPAVALREGSAPNLDDDANEVSPGPPELVTGPMQLPAVLPVEPSFEPAAEDPPHRAAPVQPSRRSSPAGWLLLLLAALVVFGWLAVRHVAPSLLRGSAPFGQ